MHTPRTMITFKPGGIRFTFRVGGILIHNEHVLCQAASDEDSWFLPGGRAELGESRLSQSRVSDGAWPAPQDDPAQAALEVRVFEQCRAAPVQGLLIARVRQRTQRCGFLGQSGHVPLHALHVLGARRGLRPAHPSETQNHEHYGGRSRRDPHDELFNEPASCRC